MIIQLIDTNPNMVTAWNNYFGGMENVKIWNSNYFSIETDILVSPGNSFGYMDGGIDQLITNYFKAEGIDIQSKVQSHIKKYYDGEILVGQCAAIYTGSKTIPLLVVAPTMRIPLLIRDAVDVYLATRSIFNLLKRMEGTHNYKNQRISICGLGTGTGGLNPHICAEKMYQAYNNYYLRNNYFPTFIEAQKSHQQL